ncbi:DUF896 domain-containing protein [Paenibacillus arenosi]|uniref:UPF0291 protein IFO66_04115 n=1 Tax=Paenibacillus arenosi TaxID=2774142 RepID=A0ABR9AUU4_9BACL|nr:DUF896 domain-containing protein [Paenibacillus arenosi]MBD8497483.1 DUF896 domain-containing protein [Paenibacillus arenosi]
MNIDDMIARINELARKHKTIGLTEEETAERAKLREEYLGLFRQQVRNNLDTIQWVEDEEENGKDSSSDIVH